MLLANFGGSTQSRLQWDPVLLISKWHQLGSMFLVQAKQVSLSNEADLLSCFCHLTRQKTFVDQYPTLRMEHLYRASGSEAVLLILVAVLLQGLLLFALVFLMSRGFLVIILFDVVQFHIATSPLALASSTLSCPLKKRGQPSQSGNWFSPRRAMAGQC